MPFQVDHPSDLVHLVGLELQSESFELTQSDVDRFIALSGDRQWIHSSAEKAKAVLPAGRTIVPGNMLLMQLPRLLQQTYAVAHFDKCYLAEYDQVRFRRPVGTGVQLFLQTRFLSAKLLRSFVRLEAACRIHFVGDPKPALAATVVDLFYPER